MPKDEVLSLLSVLWNMPGISKQFRVHDLFLMVLGIELGISCMPVGALSSRAEPYVLFLIVGWGHIQRYLEAVLESVLRGFFWQCSGDYLQWQVFEMGLVACEACILAPMLSLQALLVFHSNFFIWCWRHLLSSHSLQLLLFLKGLFHFGGGHPYGYHAVTDVIWYTPDF